MLTTDEWGLVRSDQEETEESYFVSMTDIMVGLLFIFIIMLMAFGLMLKVAAENTDKTRNEIEEAVRQTKDEVEEMQNIDSLRAQMLHDIEERLGERGVTVIVREENGVLQLPDEILFEKAESELSPKGLSAIGHLANALDDVLPCYAVVPAAVQAPPCEAQISDQLRIEAVFVEGHTDSDGTQDLNWRLSAARAISTYRALDARSNYATRLLNDEQQYLFSVAGYGENRPIVEEVDENAKRLNRRIDLRFVISVSHKEALQRVQTRLERVLKIE
jgi:chemotaxis protein MotB